MRKKYLAIFLLPKPKIEHATLRGTLDFHSGGDYKKAFITPGVAAYFFTSETDARDMDFTGGTFNEDSYLIVEVGESFSHLNLRDAANWLWDRRTRR